MAEFRNNIMMHEVLREFKLEVLYGPDGYLEREISSPSVNRPGLQLAGFFEGFNNDRIQVIGEMESLYINQFTEEKQEKMFDEIFSRGVPLMILSVDSNIHAPCIRSAEKYGVTVAKSQEHASPLIAAMISSLNVHLAPCITRHGVLLEVYGEGIFLVGDSGVGKSETAIELLKRGHRLVADDAVEIKKVSAKSLVGSAPEMIRYLMEMRGIGIVDVRRLFGMSAVKPTEKIELVINLERWDDNKVYDRMGLEDSYTEIMGINVPSLTIPVRPGRNLAVIIEVAAMNHRHKKMGHNAAKELEERLYNSMMAQQ